MAKKKRIAFTIADENNMKYAKMMEASLRKFHSEKELPLYIVTEKEINGYEDKEFFYRATPTIAKELIKDYELVLKLDADQIITGNLDFIFDNKYDVGVVYNWNRVDPQVYGEIGIATIAPQEYYNCGLVAMRSEQFVDNWYKLCYSHHFERMPYREQGFLNILGHYGNYNVLKLDDSDGWYGLRSKGEWMRVYLDDNKNLILPPTDDGYPTIGKKIKVLHWAGGNMPNKLNYRTLFTEDVIKHLDYLVDAKKQDN